MVTKEERSETVAWTVSWARGGLLGRKGRRREGAVRFLGTFMKFSLEDKKGIVLKLRDEGKKRRRGIMKSGRKGLKFHSTI